MQFGPREEILSFEEIERFVRVAAALGRPKFASPAASRCSAATCPNLIRGSRAIPGIDDLALTTNGVLLARAGRSRCTTRACGGSTSTSIRSIASAFSRSRAATSSTAVLEGIEAASALGFRRSKSMRSR